MKIFFLILGDLIRFVGKEENLEVKDTEKRDNWGKILEEARKAGIRTLSGESLNQREGDFMFLRVGNMQLGRSCLNFPEVGGEVNYKERLQESGDSLV